VVVEEERATKAAEVPAPSDCSGGVK